MVECIHRRMERVKIDVPLILSESPNGREVLTFVAYICHDCQECFLNKMFNGRDEERYK